MGNSEVKITVYLCKVLDKTALHNSLEKWAMACTLKCLNFMLQLTSPVNVYCS